MGDPVRTRPNGIPRNVQQPTAGAQVSVSPPMQHFVMNNGRSMPVGGPPGGQPGSNITQMGMAKGLPHRGGQQLPAFQRQQLEPAAPVSPFTLDQLQLMRVLVQTFGVGQSDAGEEAAAELAADTLDQIDALLETMPKPKPSAAERLKRAAPIEQVPRAIAAAAPRRVQPAPRAAIVPAPTDLPDDDDGSDTPAAG